MLYDVISSCANSQTSSIKKPLKSSRHPHGATRQAFETEKSGEKTDVFGQNDLSSRDGSDGVAEPGEGPKSAREYGANEDRMDFFSILAWKINRLKETVRTWRGRYVDRQPFVIMLKS